MSPLRFCTDPPSTELYTLSLHDALPIFLAKDNPSRVFLETGAQCFVYSVPDAIFSRRQDLLVDLGRRFGDINQKLVRRRVLRLLCFAVLAANAFLHFVIELGEFLCRDHTLLDELIFPAPER